MLGCIDFAREGRADGYSRYADIRPSVLVTFVYSNKQKLMSRTQGQKENDSAAKNKISIATLTFSLPPSPERTLPHREDGI